MQLKTIVSILKHIIDKEDDLCNEYEQGLDYQGDSQSDYSEGYGYGDDVYHDDVEDIIRSQPKKGPTITRSNMTRSEPPASQSQPTKKDEPKQKPSNGQ